MTQEEKKDILIKDLCARLDTNLVCSIYRVDDYGVGYRDEILSGYCKGDIWREFYFGDDCGICIDDVSKIKPYLIPLLSMTEEQKEELLYKYIHNDIYFDDFTDYFLAGELWHDICVSMFDLPDLINWLNKNHFDYRGLIPMGLAIDATGLNVY